MIKTSKNKATTFRLLKLIAFLVVVLLCYSQYRKVHILNVNDLKEINYIWILGALVLVYFNYYLEYLKWKSILTVSSIKTTAIIRIQSFFAGVVTAMVTPNMQGNFLGRIYYFKRQDRTPITLLTLVSNLGQFCVTIGIGLICLYFSDNEFRTYWIYPFIILVTALIGYFTFNKISILTNKIRWIKRIDDLLVKNSSFRIKVIVLSALRNMVFMTQFLVSLMAFGVEATWEIYALIGVLYLWTTLSPSLFLGKLFIRESIALWVFVGYINSSMIILSASLSLWCINLLLPTLIGIVICRKSIQE